MAIRGHTEIVRRLDEHLPRVTLLAGPYSVGRWSVAEHARWRHGISREDVLRVRTLTTETAETIREYTQVAPVESEYSLVIVDLYKSSEAAQVTLSAALDDPGHSKIIIIGQPHEVSSRIASRSTVFYFTLLEDEEVAQVLIDRMGFSADRAAELGARSGGTISGALKLANANEALDRVRAALHAIRTHDPDELESLATTWQDEDTSWLTQWCYEAIAGRWKVFEPEDASEGPYLPLRILMALDPGVRPRLVVRSQLMDVLRGNAHV